MISFASVVDLYRAAVDARARQEDVYFAEMYEKVKAAAAEAKERCEITGFTTLDAYTPYEMRFKDLGFKVQCATRDDGPNETTRVMMVWGWAS